MATPSQSTEITLSSDGALMLPTGMTTEQALLLFQRTLQENQLLKREIEVAKATQQAPSISSDGAIISECEKRLHEFVDSEGKKTVASQCYKMLASHPERSDAYYSLKPLTKAAKPLTTVVMISAEEAVLIQRSRTRQATLLSALGDVNNGAEPHLESLVIGLGGLAAQNYTPDFKAKRISLTPNVQLKGRDAFITNIELARAYLLEVQNEYQALMRHDAAIFRVKETKRELDGKSRTFTKEDVARAGGLLLGAIEEEDAKLYKSKKRARREITVVPPPTHAVTVLRGGDDSEAEWEDDDSDDL